VLIVGAGDAAQLILREMLRNPSLGYTPIGLVDDDPRKKNLRLTASASSARRTSSRAPARAPPGRASHRDSVRLGRRARADRRDGARPKRVP
jgi:hypothetical protein